jgi:hypothetical protein
MIRFFLREIANKEDTLLAIADTPEMLLEGFHRWDLQMWLVQADIDGCREDVAVIDLGNKPSQWGKRGYRVYGANPNCPECFHYVEGAESVVASVKTILQCFFARGALPDNDLIGLRVVPC